MPTPKYVLQLPEAVGLFPKGRSVVEASHAARFMTVSNVPGVEVHRLEIDDYRPLNAFPLEKAGETVLFVRPGGFGDLLFLTPTFRALKEQTPGCRIVVSCIPKFAPALEHNPDVDEIISYPPTLERWQAADSHVWLERIVEDDQFAKTLPMAELFAAEAGVTLDGYQLHYRVTPEESAWAAEAYPRVLADDPTPTHELPPTKPRVGIQVQASAVNRNYPDGQLNRVMNELATKGCEVFLFGEPGSIEADEPFVNCTADPGLTFRQSCAVLSTCDVVVAPDSALCHVAGALGLSTVALYGPFPSSLRVGHAASVAAIDGNAPCSPCFHHGNSGAEWPKDCPGWKTGRCAALSNIDGRRVARTVFLMLSGVAARSAENHPAHRGR